MSRKIKLEFTKHQMHCLLEMIASVESVLQEVPEEMANVKAIDRMFKSNGYKRPEYVNRTEYKIENAWENLDPTAENAEKIKVNELFTERQETH